MGWKIFPALLRDGFVPCENALHNCEKVSLIEKMPCTAARRFPSQRKDPALQIAIGTRRFPRSGDRQAKLFFFLVKEGRNAQQWPCENWQRVCKNWQSAGWWLSRGQCPPWRLRSIKPSKSRGWKKRWPGFDLPIPTTMLHFPLRTFGFDKSRYRDGIRSFAIETLLTTHPSTPYLPFLA